MPAGHVLLACTAKRVLPHAGRIYRDGTVANELPGLACLLAAGNHACVAVRDAMHVLFACHCLVIIKTNPCNDWTGPHLERMLGPLVNRGFVRIVYGGADVAQVCTKPGCRRSIAADAPRFRPQSVSPAPRCSPASCA